MLGQIWGQIKQGAASAASSMGITQSFVKPELVKLTVKSKDQLKTFKEQLAKIDSLKAMPELKITLSDLRKTAKKILAEASSAENLDAIANIIANHVNDFASIEEAKEKLPKMKSVKALMTFVDKLIDIENYEKLSELLTQLQDFNELKKPEQIALLKALDDKELINSIEAENKDLKVDKIQKRVKTMAQAVCKELTLSKKESDTLIKLFDELCQKHLEDLNQSRQALVEHLPGFLTRETARLRKEHPELAVAEKPAKKVLTKFKKEADSAKTSPKEKVKAEPKETKSDTKGKAKVVVKEEPADSDDETPVILSSTRNKGKKR
ncbi:hypothetical protein [Candidatus Berkiella aquae]|uniref:Uncharacterized protein n=1 Tax=Candidatus Berkiella aquae TaxID=295108 RepID=A0A0Q9YXS9_9GAMM|nr:hypothetical protein [Candidatus Berkiella aquae]MCS5710093.1 hypothetical protein [Candidatus Berkiella aquae]